MAITQAIANSFKQDLLNGVHDFGAAGDTIKMALYTSSASINAATTAYTTDGEAVGTGYTAGGATLSSADPTVVSGTAILDFADVTWSASTITARGALIYNASKSNKAILVLDFGADKSSSAGDFTVIFPDASFSDAIVRVS